MQAESHVSALVFVTRIMESALTLAQRRTSAHLALAAVVWAGAFPAIKALFDHGMAAQDIALLRYLVARVVSLGPQDS